MRAQWYSWHMLGMGWVDQHSHVCPINNVLSKSTSTVGHSNQRKKWLTDKHWPFANEVWEDGTIAARQRKSPHSQGGWM